MSGLPTCGKPSRVKSVLVLAAIGAAAAGEILGATRVQAHAPTTFSVTRLQAEEVAALVGFLRA